MQESTVDFLLRSPKGESRGYAKLQAVPRDVAVKKGVFTWLGAWGLALATIPIPIVHFIAPPLFFLAGPVAGYGVFKLFRDSIDIVRGEALCPDCSKTVAFGPCAERWPVDVVCPSCEARLYASREQPR